PPIRQSFLPSAGRVSHTSISPESLPPASSLPSGENASDWTSTLAERESSVTRPFTSPVRASQNLTWAPRPRGLDASLARNSTRGRLPEDEKVDAAVRRVYAKESMQAVGCP